MMTFRERFELLEKRREALRVAVAELEAEKQARLALLPAEHGFPDLASFVRAVQAAVSAKSQQSKPAKRKARAQPLPSQPPAPPSPTPPAAAAPVAPPPPVAVFDSLDDPANFTLLPDRSILDQGVLSAVAQRDRLVNALRFCTRVLHTSKVPAAVWREWRGFERELQDALRAVQPV